MKSADLFISTFLSLTYSKSTVNDKLLMTISYYVEQLLHQNFFSQFGSSSFL